MNYYVLALRDLRADNYLPPMYVPNIAIAIRDVSDVLKEKANEIAWAKHPEDYELYQLGIWDNDTSEFTTLNKRLYLLSELKG